MMLDDMVCDAAMYEPWLKDIPWKLDDIETACNDPDIYANDIDSELDQPVFIGPIFKDMARCKRRKSSIRKYMSRQRFWNNIVNRSKDTRVSVHELHYHRLKTMGNPFGTPAVYRGDIEWYHDDGCVSGAPYHFSRSGWEAKRLDAEIIQAKKAGIDADIFVGDIYYV